MVLEDLEAGLGLAVVLEDDAALLGLSEKRQVGADAHIRRPAGIVTWDRHQRERRATINSNQ